MAKAEHFHFWEHGVKFFFPNGIEVSLTFKPGTNGDVPHTLDFKPQHGNVKAIEVMVSPAFNADEVTPIIYKRAGIRYCEYDHGIAGWVKPSKVAKLLNICRKWDNSELIDWQA